MVQSRRNKSARKHKTQRAGTRFRSQQYNASGNISNVKGRFYGNIFLKELYYGSKFFRKYGTRTIEYKIYEILKKHKQHKNIVKIFDITNKYFDIEKLTPLTEKKYDEKTQEKIVAAAMAAKNYLQSLGIMYIDWKPDNMGIDKHGVYKLFDFDASGIAELPDCEKWETEPHKYWSYRQALEKGLKDPKEIDNFAFKIGFNPDNSEIVKLGRPSSNSD